MARRRRDAREHGVSGPGGADTQREPEHTALQPKRAEVTQGLAAAADVGDIWADDQPGHVSTGPDTPGTITCHQQSAMHAAFAALGITNRAERLEWTRKALGLAALSSSSVLSYRQAGTLLEKLDKRQREGAKA